MKRRYCNPETAFYELNGRYYTMNELADIVERKQKVDKAKRTLYAVFSLIHAVLFAYGILLVEIVDNLLMLIVAMAYCFAATVVLGLKAGGENSGYIR